MYVDLSSVLGPLVHYTSPSAPPQLLYMICVDGCDRAVYRVLDDWRRSPRSVAAVDEDLLCDDLLPPGWYRLMAGDQRAGRLAPTCPGAGVCGTVAPVWLEAPPPANGSQVSLGSTLFRFLC